VQAILWAEDVGGTVPGTALGALIVIALALVGLVGWLLKFLFSTSWPAKEQEAREQRGLYERRQDALLAHFEARAREQQASFDRRLAEFVADFRAAQREQVAWLERINGGVREAIHIDRNVLQSLVYRTQLSAVVTEAAVPIWTKTLDGVILSWNRAAEETFGWTSQEVVGQSVYLLIPPDLHEQERQLMDRLRRGEDVGEVRTERLARDGRRVKVLASVSAIKEPGGAISSVSSIARVVS
jgi:PAS domain S-box-containing protein